MIDKLFQAVFAWITFGYEFAKWHWQHTLEFRLLIIVLTAVVAARLFLPPLAGAARWLFDRFMFWAISGSREAAEAQARLIEAKANAEYAYAQARLVDEQRKLARKRFRVALWARRRRALANGFSRLAQGLWWAMLFPLALGALVLVWTAVYLIRFYYWAGRQLRGKLAPQAFAALTAAFGFATLLGIALHITWMWTLFPWLMILAFRFRSFAKAKKLVRKNFPRVLLPRLSTLWLGIWAIFVIASLTR